MIRSGVSVQGYIHLIQRDARTGKILDSFRGPNTVVNGGLTLIAERIRGNTAVSGVSSYALGGNATPPVVTDIGLNTPLYADLLTQSYVSAGELTMILHLGSSQGNGMIFREGGAFNADNTMLCRAIFPDASKTSSKEFTIIHTIPLSIL